MKTVDVVRVLFVVFILSRLFISCVLSFRLDCIHLISIVPFLLLAIDRIYIYQYRQC